MEGSAQDGGFSPGWRAEQPSPSERAPDARVQERDSPLHTGRASDSIEEHTNGSTGQRLHLSRRVVISQLTCGVHALWGPIVNTNSPRYRQESTRAFTRKHPPSLGVALGVVGLTMCRLRQSTKAVSWCRPISVLFSTPWICSRFPCNTDAHTGSKTGSGLHLTPQIRPCLCLSARECTTGRVMGIST